jgi:hypothetical protein
MKYLISAWLMLTPCWLAMAAEKLPADNEAARQVVDRMDRVRSGEIAAAYDLDADASLPYLSKYITDPDPRVRCSVAEVASKSASSDAVRILTELVLDESTWNTSGKAVDALYRRYTDEQLVKSGGPKLRENLQVMLGRSTLHADAILLLALLPDGAKSDEFLAGLSKKNPTAKTRVYRMPGDRVELPVCCDLARAKLGNAEAAARVKQRLTAKNAPTENLVFMLQNCRVVDDPALLLAMTDCMNDQRTGVVLVTPGSPSTDGTPPDPGAWLRVSEVALEQLAKKAGIDVGVDLTAREERFTMPRYSDEEIAAAQKKLRKHFAAKGPAVP